MPWQMAALTSTNCLVQGPSPCYPSISAYSTAGVVCVTVFRGSDTSCTFPYDVAIVTKSKFLQGSLDCSLCNQTPVIKTVIRIWGQSTSCLGRPAGSTFGPPFPGRAPQGQPQVLDVSCCKSLVHPS